MFELTKRDYLYWINEDGTLKEGAPEKFQKLYQEDVAEYNKGIVEYLKLKDQYRRQTGLYNIFMYEHFTGKKIV